MKTCSVTIPVLLLLLLAAQPAAADPPRIIDEDGPALGVQPLALQELWRVGGDDDEVIFGRIVDVKRHPGGNLYVLDNQLCHVVVLGPDGEHLGDLSGPGDGPGEIRQPMGLVFLTDEVLGIGMGFPGKIVTMGLDGTPGASLFPVGEPAEGNIGIMMSVQQVDGVLAAGGGRMIFQGEYDSSTQRFLSVTGDGGTEFRRILEKNTPLDPTGRRYVEVDDYYPDRSWALGAGGEIYVPLERDDYAISVFDRTGQLLRVFGRKVKPRRRTQAEKDEVSPIINVEMDVASRQWDIADHDESVTRVQIDPADGTLWVLTPQGNHDQPEGILETWDVFSAAGEYLKQVSVLLGNEMRDGNCYLVGGGRLVVVRGTGSAFNGREGAGQDGEEAEVEPLEIICYERR